MGIKDASRKVQTPSQSLGPWYGTVTNTEGGVYRLISQERQDNSKRLSAELAGMEWEGRYDMSIASMDFIKWFSVYVSNTYRDMTPNFNGVYVTL